MKLLVLTVCFGVVSADAFDWRQASVGNLVSAVRNIDELPDKSCSSASWAYSVTGMISDRLAILQPTKPKVLLSTQHLVNCVGDFGCNAVDSNAIETTLKYVKDNEGIPDRTCMGWRGEKETCSRNNICVNCLQKKCDPRSKFLKYGITSFGKVSNSIEVLKKEIADYGPVACQFTDNSFAEVVGFQGTLFTAKLDRGVFTGNNGFMDIAFTKVRQCWWAKVSSPYLFHDKNVTETLSLKSSSTCGRVWSENVRANLNKNDISALSRRLSSELPNDFAWSWLTPVQSHHNGPGYCGACWSMASSSSFSDRLKILHGANKATDVFVSPQTNVDCAYEPSDGCGGGGAEDAFTLMQKTGTVDETCNAWVSGPQKCVNHGASCKTCAGGKCEEVSTQNFNVYRAESFGALEGEDSIKEELFARGPVTCGIATPEALSEDYVGSGILCDHDTPPKDWSITHLVTIVGWGEQDGNKYWIIRNSWGTHWGDNGFAKICRGQNAPGGNMLLESACTWVMPQVN